MKIVISTPMPIVDPMIFKMFPERPRKLTPREKDMKVLYIKAEGDFKTYLHLADRAYRMTRSNAKKYYDFIRSLES